MLFNQFKIKKEHIGAIKILIESIDVDRELLFEVGERMKDNKKLLFKSLRELYPEIKDYEFSINHKTHVVTIIGRKD